MKLKPSFKLIKKPEEQEIDIEEYQKLYNQDPVYSHTIDYPAPGSNPEKPYEGFENKPEWLESTLKIQMDDLVEKLAEFEEAFLELKQYFKIPEHRASMRTALDDLKLIAEKIYFRIEFLKSKQVNIDSYKPIIKAVVFLCIPGALSNLELILNAINITPERLFYNAKEELLRGLAREFLQTTYGSEEDIEEEYIEGNEIHEVAKLANSIASEYGLLHDNDIYAQNPSDHKDDFNFFLSNFLNREDGVLEYASTITRSILLYLPAKEQLLHGASEQIEEKRDLINDWIKI
ncbi:MAG: hypothetical protein AABY27_01540, partial [Pseudomonadota bacterium]